MKIEIWSDVVCPFCYIGKRKFEKALEGFDQKEQPLVNLGTAEGTCSIDGVCN